MSFALLAALIGIPSQVGYPALAALVGAESMGIPVPGETALIAAALLARHGTLDLQLVILCAAAGAIVGDNLGYEIARKGGRRLFQRPGPLLEYRRRILEHGEPFFARHGAKAVFLGRWVAVLRIGAAWLAGLNGMPWPRFMFWNALGGIAWATSIAVAAYLLGSAAETLLRDAGVAGAVLAAVALGVVVTRLRRARTR